MKGRLADISLLVVVVSAAVWLGGINIRAMMGFDLLQTGTLDFKPNVHPYVERAVFSLVAQSSLIVNTAYVVLWVAGVCYLRFTPLRLKVHGWLMMAAILFYLFTPVEVYAIVLDVRMWMLDAAGSNDLVEFRKLFIHRLAALSGVPMIALLCYYSALAAVVFKPLRRMSPAAPSAAT